MLERSRQKDFLSCHSGQFSFKVMAVAAAGNSAHGLMAFDLTNSISGENRAFNTLQNFSFLSFPKVVARHPGLASVRRLVCRLLNESASGHHRRFAF
jgi:hypothetical protein